MQLARTILPLGEMTKPEVRQHALRFSLPVADKKDSQDLCFLGGDDYRMFLQQYAPESMQPGNIVTTSGEVIGEHTGLAAYTIGQRKNIGISDTEPYYVISKDMTKNRLVVGKKPELFVSKITINDTNWVTGIFPGHNFMADVMVRYRAKMQEAEIAVNNANGATIQFADSARDVTPVSWLRFTREMK